MRRVVNKNLRNMAVGLALTALVVVQALAEFVLVPTPSGTLQMDMPLGYNALSHNEIQEKFGRAGRIPLVAWGNSRRTSTVAVTWSEMKQKPLSSDQLPEFQAAMEAALPKLTPGLVFQSTGLVTIGQRQWVRLDSTVPALDTTIRNLMYLTDWGGHMIGVNYNATVADFASQEAGFIQSAGTLLRAQ